MYQEFIIGGLNVNIYGLDNLNQSKKLGIVCQFLLHGRGESQLGEIYKHIAEKCISETYNTPDRERNLIVVTLDHRNHGSRFINEIYNQGWPKNANHCIDMFSIQHGTSLDVSYLIDYLPSFLFPNDEHKIVDWACSGLSLGGHSTWLALKQDSRISVGVPMIACADYLSLMNERGSKYDIKLEQPVLPSTLAYNISKFDPMASFENSKESWNGKKICVLSGNDDKLVPHKHQVKFIDNLKNYYQTKDGVIVAKAFEGVKHEVNEEMQITCARFILNAAVLCKSYEELQEIGLKTNLLSKM